MKATLKNYRQSPRKVRLVADFVRGKKVAQAIQDLTFLPKRASRMFMKLINSAVANAKVNDGKNPEELVVGDVSVDQGVTLKRIRPRSRGMAHRINKRTSNVVVELATEHSPVVSSDKEEKDSKKLKAPSSHKASKDAVKVKA